jgi:hypothetical protein
MCYSWSLRDLSYMLLGLTPPNSEQNCLCTAIGASLPITLQSRIKKNPRAKKRAFGKNPAMSAARRGQTL